jgi:hypothetical protein
VVDMTSKQLWPTHPIEDIVQQIERQRAALCSQVTTLQGNLQHPAVQEASAVLDRLVLRYYQLAMCAAEHGGDLVGIEGGKRVAVSEPVVALLLLNFTAPAWLISTQAAHHGFEVAIALGDRSAIVTAVSYHGTATQAALRAGHGALEALGRLVGFLAHKGDVTLSIGPENALPPPELLELSVQQLPTALRDLMSKHSCIHIKIDQGPNRMM